MLQDLRKEAGALRGQSQQSATQVRHLEEELGKATKSCSQRQSLVEELKGELVPLGAPCRMAEECESSLQAPPRVRLRRESRI